MAVASLTLMQDPSVALGRGAIPSSARRSLRMTIRTFARTCAYHADVILRERRATFDAARKVRAPEGSYLAGRGSTRRA